MTIRKLLAMSIALLMVVSVAACAKDEKVTSEEKYGKESVELETWGAFLVISSDWIQVNSGSGLKQFRVYDPDTSVEYVIVGNGDTVECMPLYNADGTLKLYNPNNAEAN